jgi:hypothetical protein
MFTLFFGGKQFAPNAVINGQNIQDYLQDCMFSAMLYFYKRIFDETDLFETSIIGVETMNEPNRGNIGVKDITKIPDDQHCKLGTCPTSLEAMLLGMGKKVDVTYFTFGNFGPSKAGKRTIDPKGETVWLQDNKYDLNYGWKRGQNWKLGSCIWAQHGVYDVQTGKALIANYFGVSGDGEPMDEIYFVNNHFVSYWAKFHSEMRKNLSKTIFLLCQPPTMAMPPLLKDSEFMDDRVIYAPHFYDGLTIMLKKWNTAWNVDCIGVLRGKYVSSVFGIKIGETNIRNCLKEQLQTIKKEGVDYMGPIPCLMSETGIPFDMNNRDSYFKTGDYTSQTKALDAFNYALEGAMISHTFWAYDVINTNVFGDFWNGEDFSFWSNDRFEQQEYSDQVSTISIDNGNKTAEYALEEGMVRAKDAVVRPYPITTNGKIKSYSFDLKTMTFTLNVQGQNGVKPTEIFLPAYHFPPDLVITSVTSGKVVLDSEKSILLWWHDEGDLTLEIKSAEVEAVSETGQCCKIM